MKLKFCKSCKHSSEGFMAFDTCNRSVVVKGHDLVNGRKVQEGWRATRDERSTGRLMARLTGTCGKEGRFWEEKK